MTNYSKYVMQKFITNNKKYRRSWAIHIFWKQKGASQHYSISFIKILCFGQHFCLKVFRPKSSNCFPHALGTIQSAFVAFCSTIDTNSFTWRQCKLPVYCSFLLKTLVPTIEYLHLQICPRLYVKKYKHKIYKIYK